MADRDRKRPARAQHARIDNEESKVSVEPPTSAAARRPTRPREPMPKPARCLNAYNFFFQAERRRMLDALPPQAPGKTSHGVGFASMARAVSQRWKSLSDQDRAQYEALAAKDKQRYIREMNAWYKHNNEDDEEDAAEEGSSPAPAPGGEPSSASEARASVLPQQNVSHQPAIQSQTSQRTATSGVAPGLAQQQQDANSVAISAALLFGSNQHAFQTAQLVQPSLPVQAPPFPVDPVAPAQTTLEQDKEAAIDDDIMREFLSNPLTETDDDELPLPPLQQSQQIQLLASQPANPQQQQPMFAQPANRQVGLPSISIPTHPTPQLFGSPAPGFLDAAIQPLTPLGARPSSASPREEAKAPDVAPLSLPRVSIQPLAPLGALPDTREEAKAPETTGPLSLPPVFSRDHLTPKQDRANVGDQPRRTGNVAASAMPARATNKPTDNPVESDHPEKNKEERYEELASRLGPDAVKFLVDAFHKNKKTDGAAS